MGLKKAPRRVKKRVDMKIEHMFYWGTDVWKGGQNRKTGAQVASMFAKLIIWCPECGEEAE
jgi:hypothetical protein